jgi:hypothetical protein
MEIWRSFVGVLKSYAVVASPPVSVHSVEVGRVADVVLDAGAAYMSFAFDAARGRGSLRMLVASNVEVAEQFALGADGTISFSDASGDSPEELDHAAIRLLGSLTKAVNRDKIEVMA